MAFDVELAERLREVLAAEGGVVEKPMFGGLAFLIGGHLAVSVSRDGGIVLRCDPADTDKLVTRALVRPLVMRGREMNGWLRVDPEALRTRRQLQSWADRGVAFARSLPPKAPRRRP